jgi:small-conductance mechanosensitive channel
VQTFAWTLAAALGLVAVTLLVVEIIHRIFVRLGRRSVVMAELSAHCHRAFQVFSALFALRLAFQLSSISFGVREGVLHAMLILLIGAGAWLLTTALFALEDAALHRYRVDVPDNRAARRIRTQIVVLRRVTIAATVVLALGLALMTFPQVRTIGTSLLASAGIIGIVAALAAQSVLGNVIAGLQLAFSDAIRLDDVIVVENEWAKVEEITLTHVVLQIWDDRRLILPTSYFTTKPYQNWTRTKAEVLGSVEFDVDWTAPVGAMREELHQMVQTSDLWDGRVCVLQVTDAIGGTVRLRALVSAVDAPSLWDLRCQVREHLIGWVRDESPSAMPRTRAELSRDTPAKPWAWTYAPPAAETPAPDTGEHARVFSGSEDGEARGHAFTGPEPSLQDLVLTEQDELDLPDEAGTYPDTAKDHFRP